MVQLFYREEPKLDLARLAERVEVYCGRIDSKSRATSMPVQYFMLDALAEFKEGRLPVQLCLLPTEQLPKPESFAPALQQTWDWEEAAATVAACRHVLIANDFMAASLAPLVRNRLFRGFIRAIQEVAPCEAMHWMNTQRFVEPARFGYLQGEPDGQQLHGSLNVRFFNIEGGTGEFLMDTLGLAALGLPDLQCHFRKLDPGSVAAVLYNASSYILERGDVIHDGETVPGILQNDQWTCQHEMALVGPKRVVLDLNPGEGYAAER